MSQDPSLEGRRFRVAAMDKQGEASAETVFEYHQNGDLIWATYQGGAVRLGFLVGTRDGDTLDFRYSQLNEWARPRTATARRRSPCCPTAGSPERVLVVGVQARIWRQRGGRNPLTDSRALAATPRVLRRGGGPVEERSIAAVRTAVRRGLTSFIWAIASIVTIGLTPEAVGNVEASQTTTFCRSQSRPSGRRRNRPRSRPCGPIPSGGTRRRSIAQCRIRPRLPHACTSRRSTGRARSRRVARARARFGALRPPRGCEPCLRCRSEGAGRRHLERW